MFRLFLSSQTLLFSCLTYVCVSGESETSGATHFRYVDGLIWVEVDLEQGGDPLHFVVDTGAGKSVIDLQSARESGIRLGRTVRVQGVGGSARAYRVKRIPASLAGMDLPEQMLALDLSAVSAHCHQRLDGLIGIDFFKDRMVQIDFDGRKIRIESACLPLIASDIEIPLIQLNDAWCAAIEVQGIQAQPIRIDTGFDGGLKWRPSPLLRDEAAGSQVIGTGTMPMAATDTILRLGSLQVDGLELTRLDRQFFPGESGLLGNAFFSQFQVTFCLSEKKMFLQTGKSSKPDFAVHPLD